jgi:hypothetical protein
MDHFIYIVSSPHELADGFIKIGSTGDMAARIVSYHTAHPGVPERRPETLALFHVNDPSTEYRARCVERYFAMMHGAKKTDNEWYVHMAVEEAARIIECLECTRIFEIPRVPVEHEYAPAYAGFPPCDPSSRAHFATLAIEQDKIVHRIVEFLTDPSKSAITIIAPCGFGKTRMTIDALARANVPRCDIAICAPTLNLCQQWRGAIGEGVRVETNISSYDTFMPILDHMRVVVFDEAHHMAGVVAQDDGDGNGATRRLLAYLCANAPHIKRIFLTFTPRNACARADASDDGYEYLSMDDVQVFGEQICVPDIRKCVELGLLPDYRITAAQCARVASDVDALPAKCAQLARLFEARDHWNREMYMLSNVLVFVPRIEDIARCARLLEEVTTTRERVIISAYAEESAHDIARFRALAQESRDDRLLVMISCRVLSEGVDIPEACAVAIMYPKKSPIDITQMVLRAGRWSPLKPAWHMIFPLAQDEDYSGFKSVLSTLAVHDSRIIDDAMRVRARGHRIELLSMVATAEEVARDDERMREPLELFVDTFDATNLARIGAYFGGLITEHAARFARDSRELYDIMVRANVTFKIRDREDYAREIGPHGILPIKLENPHHVFGKFWKSWYEFVQFPERVNYPKTARDLAKLCREHDIADYVEYMVKRANDPAFRAITPKSPCEMYGDFANFAEMMDLPDPSGN